MLPFLGRALGDLWVCRSTHLCGHRQCLEDAWHTCVPNVGFITAAPDGLNGDYRNFYSYSHGGSEQSTDIFDKDFSLPLWAKEHKTTYSPFCPSVPLSVKLKQSQLSGGWCDLWDVALKIQHKPPEPNDLGPLLALRHVLVRLKKHCFLQMDTGKALHPGHTSPAQFPSIFLLAWAL